MDPRTTSHRVSRAAVAIVLCGAMLLTGVACSEVPADDAAPAVVLRVIDGDTAQMLVGGTKERVRFIGIDTPETHGGAEPFGAEAAAFTSRAIEGRRVWVETDVELRDRYGRLLAYVWLDPPQRRDSDEVAASMLNARLVLDGYAMVSTYPPNVRYVDVFTELQRTAREEARGLWGPDGQGLTR